MIEAKNVSLIYGDGTVALKDVNLKIDSGDIVYITGPSGSGKTSLLKLFMGIEYPTTGELKILNLIMKKENSSDIRRLRKAMGPVFQEFKLIKGRTALDNTMLGMRFLGMPNKQIKEESKSALIRVGLGHKIDSLVEHLSFGETQRVAMARAVVRKPAIILADEPTGNLDKDNALNILELLASLKNKDTTIIVTTHATHLIEDIEIGKFIKVDSGNILIEVRGEAK